MFWQLVLIMVLAIPALAIVLDSQVGKALASHIERRSLPPAEGADQGRIELLEGEVQRLGEEVERLSEASQFFQNLLAERSEDDPLLPPSTESADV